MRVKAKHNFKWDGTLYPGGSVFEISTTDMDVIGDYVEVEETPLEIPEEKPEPAKKPRGGRRRAE